MKKNFFKISLMAICTSAVLSSCSSEDLQEKVSGSQAQEAEVIESPYAIDKDEAKTVLEDFLNSNYGVATKNAKKIKVENCTVRSYQVSSTEEQDADDYTGNEKVPVYEFITQNDETTGYAVVVGDKRIQKVLISVEQGSLDDTTYIEPLRDYFRSIPNFINSDLEQYYAGDQSLEGEDSEESEITFRMSAETQYHFLPTIWSQSYPYNSKCPASNCYDGHYPAGCVAIAIAQIMAYHKVPSSLNWTAILQSNTVTSGSSQTVIEQVGSLIAQIGNRVNMSYGCNGSGAFSSKAQSVFNSYGLSCESLQSFSLEKIKNSLSNDCPVYMDGHADAVGHAWVCDGWKKHIYSSTEYYEYLNMNWGWGGNSNGFYYVSNPVAFNTGSYTFYNLNIIPNIR